MDYQLIKEVSGMVGLMFFLILFVGVVIWTFKPGSKDRFKEYAEIPFKEDNDDGE